MPTPQPRPAGYAFLIIQHQLNVIPNWHTSLVGSTGTRSQTEQEGQVTTVYPRAQWPGDGLGAHLEFALKYDGVNLGILAALFEVVAADELADWIKTKPTGKYTRKVWFLYELLTGKQLPLPDLSVGNYLPLLEPERYYTSAPGRRAPRQRILDNLLGGRDFCPLIRRTAKLGALEDLNLRQRSAEVLTSYPPELIRRALSYLYTKETKSSFAIEHQKPSASRTEKFIGLLQMAELKDYCVKPRLIEAQNLIVDPRFQDTDYRTSQNYVGQSLNFQKQFVHYVSPQPDDIPALMKGLLAAHQIMEKGAVPAVIHAAAVSYGLVFLHPFEDGNGRLHRFLVHNILHRAGVVPPGLMFPVSAAMLKNPLLYDQSLEAFSRPLLRLVEYDLDETGRMTVSGDTGRYYRYLDMTVQAEALYEFVRLTIEQELVEELDFLAGYDRTKQAMQEIVDMPDRLNDLFLNLCLQNHGRLSASKRKAHFGFLTEDELARLENAVREGFPRG
ncbi:MAG: Fic family protein [Deltaproteobacteria bacterium]|nr:Fic family protein [Deltaproteobacteria bacterium]